MIINPIQAFTVNNPTIKLDSVIYGQASAERVGEKLTLLSSNNYYSPIDNRYIIKFQTQNNLNVDISGVNSANIGNDGINIDEAFTKNHLKLKSAVEKYRWTMVKMD